MFFAKPGIQGRLARAGDPFDDPAEHEIPHRQKGSHAPDRHGQRDVGTLVLVQKSRNDWFYGQKGVPVEPIEKEKGHGSGNHELRYGPDKGETVLHGKGLESREFHAEQYSRRGGWENRGKGGDQPAQDYEFSSLDSFRLFLTQ